MDAVDLVLTLTALIIFALLGGEIGRRRGQAFIGFIAGFLLGPIGWLAVYLSYPEIKQEQPAKPFNPPKPYRGPPRLKKYSEQLEKDAAWERARLGE